MKTKKGIEIRIFMIRQGIKNKNIASELKIEPSAVSRFINGELTSSKLKNYFISKGCSSSFFYGGKVV